MEGEDKTPTPMMKQFLELKRQYSDCILLFRAGDFYETFYDDAKISSKVLGITLTQRGGTPMAGVPFHSINPYIKKLIQNNYKIALCEQLEDPKLAKGLVKRGVTRVITPGTILEDDYLTSENNYIMCIYSPKQINEKFGIAIADITTGEFFTTEITKLEDVKTVIKKYSPHEIILNENSYIKGLKNYIESNNIYFNHLSDIRFNFSYANEILKKQFGFKGDELGLEQKEYAIISCGAMLFYIYKLQKFDLSHINSIKYLNLSSNMILDSITLRNLEITESIFSKDKNKTLYGILNNTKTAIGSRLLKKHLISPLIELKEIKKRHEAILEFNELIFERDDLRNLLDDFSDIERITSRISSGIVSPKDLYALRISLEKLPKIKENLNLCSSDLLKEIKKIELLLDVVKLITDSIDEKAPPAHTRDIGYIKPEFDSDLKQLFDITYNSKDFLEELEESQRLKTGISTLKIRYNRVFGYFIDVPKAQIHKVPADYVPKQTLTNAMRYTTPELKEKENLIFGAEEKIKILEKEIFDQIILKLKTYIKKFQEISTKIGLLDVITTHSYNSQIYNYVKPEFNLEKTEIFEGRNPIVERFVDQFISNDTIFNSNETLKIVTGPNMAGKSTYLRQNALIVAMAQSGSFIPVQKANLKIYDRVFTRIGAHDELSEGQSTFMVEMTETANILNNATKKSLVLLDEIGRGTSTYDGLSLAWAITEELCEKKSDTIFATHYHQLNKLSEFYPTIENYNVMVREEGEKVEFIRKIIKGGTDKSYGIYVAKLAGVPQKVLERAKEVQKNIEEKEEIIIKQEFKESLQRRSKLSKTDDKNKGLGEFI